VVGIRGRRAAGAAALALASRAGIGREEEEEEEEEEEAGGAAAVAVVVEGAEGGGGGGAYGRGIARLKAENQAATIGGRGRGTCGK
jgi:hypothetical protein